MAPPHNWSTLTGESERRSSRETERPPVVTVPDCTLEVPSHRSVNAFRLRVNISPSSQDILKPTPAIGWQLNPMRVRQASSRICKAGGASCTSSSRSKTVSPEECLKAHQRCQGSAFRSDLTYFSLRLGQNSAKERTTASLARNDEESLTIISSGSLSCLASPSSVRFNSSGRS